MDIRTQRLNEAFNASGLTQTELCERTGLTKGAISSYLSGRYFPKQKTIERLAKALNVLPEYLMGWAEEDGITVSSEDLIDFSIRKDKDLYAIFERATQDKSYRERLIKIVELMEK